MQLSYRLKKSPDFIFDYLTDMQKFVSVHPLIFQIDRTKDENYLVHEKLKLGYIPFYFTYPVTIEKNSIDKVVIIRATVMKLTKIDMTFVIKTDQDHTTVDEHILFKSPLPIKNMMQRIFKKQHHQLFQNIGLK